MDQTALLSQLRDIHPPEPISFWPLAPGWWLVIALSILTVSIGVFIGLRMWRATTWRRQAKKHFDVLRDQYQRSPSLENAMHINKLLKQVISSAKQDRRFLQMHSDEWFNELLKVKRNGKTTSILKEEEAHALSKGMYASNQVSLDSAMLDRLALWIRYIK